MSLENLPDALNGFLQKIADDLRCPICQTTFRDPYSSPCNHTFCKDCIVESQSQSDLISKIDACPVCQSRIPKKGLISVKSTGKIAASFLEFFEALGYGPENSQKRGLLRQIIENSITVKQIINQSPVSVTQLLAALKIDIDNLGPSLQNVNLMDDLILAVDQRILAQEKVLAAKRCIIPTPVKRRSSTCSSVDTNTTKKKKSVVQDILLEENSPCQRNKLISNSNPEVVIVAQPNRITFLGTHLTNPTQKSNLSKLARLFGAHVVNTFSSEVSHLITEVDKGTARRTMKYFQAILRGIWLVSYEWVEASLQAKQLLPEEEFEISGDENHGNMYVPRKARLRAASGDSPLFRDLHVVLHGEFTTPSKKDLIELITLGGGQIISKVKPEDKNLKVICDNTTDAARRQEVHTKYGTIPLSADWVLDCISTYELLDESMFSGMEF